jgi:ClpP class serine protease
MADPTQGPIPLQKRRPRGQTVVGAEPVSPASGVPDDQVKLKADLRPWSEMVQVLAANAERLRKGDLTPIRGHIADTISTIIAESPLASSYNIVLLMQDVDAAIASYTRDRIYSSLSQLRPDLPVLLVIASGGGEIAPAYLISKFCKEFAGQFEVAVPRAAKSAATLIALGADQIHMGPISELGPIDPQLRKMPALAIGDAVRYLAGIAADHPQSAEMLATFLHKELDIQYLGFTQRIAESAAQYATRLLSGKPLPANSTPDQVADRFVNGYKDHGFVIDRDEALLILGPEIVKYRTEQYKLGNALYQFFENFSIAVWLVSNRTTKQLQMIGETDDLYVSIQV